MDSDFLYHYTTIENWHNILGTLSEENKLIFYASDVFSLNDPKEVFIGYDLITQLIKQVEQEIDSDRNVGIGELLEQNDGQTKLIEIFKEAIPGINIRSFVISFSNIRDFMPMWSMYGKNGNGIVIKYNKSELQNLGILEKVVYVHESGNGITLNTADLDMLKCYFKKAYLLICKEYVNWDELHKLQFFAMLCAYVCPMVKHDAYKYEDEERILLVNAADKNIKFRVSSSGNIIPYKECPLPVSAITEIIIGPCCDFDVVERVLRMELANYGIKNIKITQSTVPYR
ncbi:MAG: DUF2971 domain-containing protein [Bacteroidaceae bacterium]|nr:DUF2971 domain-containing protein [Bacteroidaceae bacterium]